MASSRRGALAALIAAVVVLVAGAAVLWPSVIGLGDDEVAEFVLLPLTDGAGPPGPARVAATARRVNERAARAGVNAEVRVVDDRILVGLPEGIGADALIEDLARRGRLVAIDLSADRITEEPAESLRVAAQQAAGKGGNAFLFGRDGRLVAGPTETAAGLDSLVAATLPTGVPEGATRLELAPQAIIAVRRDALGGGSDLVQRSYVPLRPRPLARGSDIAAAERADAKVVLTPRRVNALPAEATWLLDDAILGPARPLPGGRVALEPRVGAREAAVLAAIIAGGPLQAEVAVVERR